MMNNYPLGWLSSAGDFIACRAYEHYQTAKELVAKYNLVDTSDYYDDTLLHNNWVQISISELDHNYRIWWKNFLTEDQRNFLRKYFDSETITVNQMCRIRWDRELDSDYPDMLV